MTKAFRIGEYAIGGIIKATKKNHDVSIQALDWNTKAVVMEKSFNLFDVMGMEEYLNELTSSYYACKVIDWIKEEGD